MKPKILAIIPARGGSKGVPHKNIYPLCNKPLIHYSIKSALSSNYIDRVIVSTDDEKIAQISRECGAEVPFLRPKSLAHDKSNVEDTIYWTLDTLYHYDKYDPEILVLLFATYPFRTRAMLDEIIKIAIEDAITVKSVCLPEDRQLFVPVNSGAKPFINYSLRGNYPAFVSVGVASAYNMAPRGCRHYENPSAYQDFIAEMGKKGIKKWQTYMYTYLIKDAIMTLDVDTAQDFEVAEEILKNGYFKFDFPI
jgi:CMP-N-acetylneuraminic acid synthetase